MGPLDVITAGAYNLFYAASIAAGAWVMWRIGRAQGWAPAVWSCAVIAWVMGGVIGALLPGLAFADLFGARSAIGAVAGATIALVVAARALRLPALPTLDTSAIAVPLGGAVVRIGCFLAGCCEGTATTLPIGYARHADDVARHPAQLYEASIELVLAALLTRRLRRDSRPGSAFLLSLGSLAGMRFMLEFVREGRMMGALSLAQWITAPVAIICIAILGWTQRNHMPAEAAVRRRAAGALPMVMAGAFMVFVLLAARLPALERSTLTLAAIVLVVGHLRRVRGAGTAGATALALQMPAISTDSTFPRIYQSVGIGGMGGAYDHVTRIEYCNDIDPPSEWVRHHAFSGGAIEYGRRLQQSETRGMGFRARAFAANHRAGPVVLREGTLPSDVSPGPYERSIRGALLAGDMDWKYLGISVGSSFGRLYVRSGSGFANPNELGKEAAFPALGLRVGPLTGGSVELRVGDEAPMSFPSPVGSLAIASGDENGNRMRVGLSEIGAFASFRAITPQGLEFTPFVSVGGDCDGCSIGRATQGSLMVRKWFRVERRPPAAK